MNDIDKYNGNRFSRNIANLPDPLNSDMDSPPSLIGPLKRRWYIVLLTVLLICLAGMPAIYFFDKMNFQATAAIRVAPVIPSILFGGKDPIPMYKNFMFTQSELISSDKVLKKVVEDLKDKNIDFFKEPQAKKLIPTRSEFDDKKPKGPVAALRRAITSETLFIRPEDNTELIKISMKGSDPNHAAQIVNSFVQAYMSLVVTDDTREEDHKLNVLRDQRKDLAIQLKTQKQAIREMSEEYGTDTLTERQQIKLQRVAALQAKLTEFEMRRITLEVQVQLIKGNKNTNVSPQEMLKLRYSFVNADLMVQNLTSNLAEMEQLLITARQTLAPTNPELQRKAKIISILTQRLEQRRQEVGKSFDEMVVKESQNSDKTKQRIAESELEQILAHENHLRKILTEEDTKTIKLGQKQLAIQDMQDQMILTKEYYEMVKRGIQEIQMEMKRPARISVAYDATSILLPGKRKKYAIALLFGSMACGMLLAILRDKADMSLRTPDDITKRVGVRVLGTTTSAEGVKKSLISQQIACDYQAICANLGLFGTDDIPKTIVVTSPAPREGKTTLSINLASSIAKSGKTVLLIDGDLRKPDISKLLNLKPLHNGLSELLINRRFKDVVSSMPMGGFFVLTSRACNPAGIYQVIAQKRTLDILNEARMKYDHIIIDSPPLLAVPDALLWSKLADAVILTSFAGHTEAPDLKEAIERLNQAGVNVIGTVLNDVPISYSYNRYGQGYYANMAGNKRTTNRKHNKRILLLPTQKQRAETRTKT